MSELEINESQKISINDRGMYLIETHVLNSLQIAKRRKTIQTRIISLRTRIQDSKLNIQRMERNIQTFEEQLKILTSPLAQAIIKREEDKRLAIYQKAQALLEESLGSSTYQALQEHGSFTFVAEDNITYKIDKTGRVFRKNNKQFEQLCIIRPSNLPLPDFILALFINIREHPTRYKIRYRRR